MVAACAGRRRQRAGAGNLGEERSAWQGSGAPAGGAGGRLAPRAASPPSPPPAPAGQALGRPRGSPSHAPEPARRASASPDRSRATTFDARATFRWVGATHLSMAPDSHPSDRDLADAVRDHGDEHAFRALYRRHTPQLYPLVRRLLAGGPGEAEDVVQETWLRAVQALDRFRWESAFATWITGI